MTERLRSASTVGYPPSPKMEHDLSPRKTMLVLVIVVGCFAVLWPKVFYPMLVGSANQHIKPSPIDKTTGCCDVIYETDVNTIKIMSELCGTIIKGPEDKPLTGKEIVQRCRREVLETCGIDISVVLQEQVRLGQNVKQILDEIRSLNGSLCLKYNYGVAPWRLGVPHRVLQKTASEDIRQERPMHLRSELVHPAFRERGRAIPQPQVVTPTRPPPRVVEGRPGPIPGMRPTIGGAGHVVPPSKQGTSSMSVIMPIYTIGIVIFFTYTLMKIIFKKQPDSVGGSLYPPVDPDPHFRKEVFESESSRLGSRLTRENIASKLVVNAMSALLDEVDQEIEARRKSSEVASQDLVNGTLSNGDAVKPQDEDQPTVKVLGMEMTASCEGGKKWSRPDSPVLPTSPPPPAEPVPPPQEIYLEGALPAQSQLLVADSATEPEPTSGEDPAVVLSGKMTLSVISIDSENGNEPEIEEAPEITTKSIEDEEIGSAKIQQLVDDLLNEDLALDEHLEKSLANLHESAPPPSSGLEKDIQDFLENLKIQAPTITLDSEDVPHTLEVESLEKEVDELIQEAIESIQQKEEPTNESLLQLSNDLPEKSPKLELKQDISNEIERLIQEVKDLPVILQKPRDDVPTPETTIEPVVVKENNIEPEVIEEKTEAPSDLKQEISDKIDVEVAKLSSNEVEEAAEVSSQPVEEKSDTVAQDAKSSSNLDVVEPVVNKVEIAAKPISLDVEEEVVKPINDPVEIEETASEPSDFDTVVTNTSSNLDIVEPVVDKIEEVVKPSSEPVKLEETTSKPSNLDTVVTNTSSNLDDKSLEAEEIGEEVSKPSSPFDRVDVEKNAVVQFSEPPKPSSDLAIEPLVIEEKIDKTEVAKPSDKVENEEKPSITLEENKSKFVESDDEELGSDEELVEEIEEIVYEEESSEEEIEIEVEEESEDEIPVDRNTNRTESSSVQRVNGERSDDLVEESKYTTVSGATAAENEISDEELMEEVEEEEEEIIEVEEEIEDEDYVNEEGNDVNHVSGESEPEL